MKALYKILGVDEGASEAEIKRAYRKLAKSHHPDLHKDDPEAEARFKEITAAYAILGDEEKRARYDRGEIDESGQEKPQAAYYRQYGGSRGPGGFEAGPDLSSVFADLFGGLGGARARPARGQDLSYSLEVDFLDAVRGATKTVTMPDGKSLRITIPAGLQPNQKLRLRGEGAPGPAGAPPGDALVEILVRPHPFFERRGSDIHIDLPIGIDEAALGAKVQTPTIDGPVNLTVPKGSNNNRTLRLRGRGVLDPKTGQRGDQYVTLRIVMPPKIDEALARFMAEWRKDHPYDPRAGMLERAA